MAGTAILDEINTVCWYIFSQWIPSIVPVYKKSDLIYTFFSLKTYFGVLIKGRRYVVSHENKATKDGHYDNFRIIKIKYRFEIFDRR